MVGGYPEHCDTQFRPSPDANYLSLATTRGIFRIPGSIRAINALQDYYCHIEKDGSDITGTVRCATLPAHIKASPHDVASTFKRLLGGLPGGILGSLPVFDALVAIHSQLQGDPEFNKTKESKVRGRLVALAIGTMESQFQRELVCAVFGILSVIGRAAEIAPREDESGRPLPTSDLMGYNALGIVFGPLLIGDLLDSYTMKLANPTYGLLLFPSTPPKLRKERLKKVKPSEEVAGPMTVDKIHVANDITEMLITHWREVVRHMKSLQVLKTKRDEQVRDLRHGGLLRSSASDSFVIRKPRGWDSGRPSQRASVRSVSPTPYTPTPASELLLCSINLVRD